MQILQVLPHLSKGGAERVVIELSNELVAVGHNVTLLLAYPVNPILNQQYLDERVKVDFVLTEPGKRILQYLKLPFWVAKNWRVLRSYEVIHCHLTYGLVFGFLTSFARRFNQPNQVRLIATCHMVGVGVSRSNRFLNRRFSYFFDVFALMAQDKYWREFRYSKKRKNIHIVPNGISAEKKVPKSKADQDKLTRTSGNEIKAYAIGTISRLQAERKPWLFLEIFSRVQELMNGDDVRFILGGEGAERDALTKQSQRLGLVETLSMPGLVQDPKEVLEKLDLYIGLNVEGITGIAGLEAVFAGVPVVSIQLAQNYGNGANDWIWSDEDPLAVARKIVDYLKSPNQLAIIAGEQYKLATENFSVELMRDNYLDLYKIDRNI
jgi:glycosyltransferase involved in cell wall biosynthesis